MVLSGLLMGCCVLCVLDRSCWSKPQVAGLALFGQRTLSVMWSIHREAAVQLMSLDKEKQTLVKCWRALFGQRTLSVMWSIHREAAVQLMSLDKEKQTLVKCWRAHPIH